MMNTKEMRKLFELESLGFDVFPQPRQAPCQCRFERPCLFCRVQKLVQEKLGENELKIYLDGLIAWRAQAFHLGKSYAAKLKKP